MLRITLLEFLLRGLPEAFLMVFAVYSFSKITVMIKKYIITSMLFVIAVCLIRLLPIQYGVHTILNIIVLIVLTVNINKINIIKSIQASIMVAILEFICEGINMFIIQYIFRLNVKYVLSKPLVKTLYGLPSLLIFAAIVSIYYFRLAKRNKLTEVKNGEDIK